MPKIKLRLCPFCGSEAHMEVIPAHKHIFADMPDCDGEVFVFCDSCSAAVSGRNEQDAAEAWNHRADTRNESQAVLDDGAFGACPNCEYEFNLELRNEYEIRYCPNCGQKLDWRTDNGNGMDQC